MSATGDGDGTIRHPDADTFLITGAGTSLEDQHKARVRKYVLIMSFRIPALLIASLVYVTTHNAWWAVGILLFSIPLPWIAVLIANDRPARKRGEVQYYKFGAGRTVGPAELPAEATPPASETAPDRVIESRVVDGDVEDSRDS
ncbi:MAG: DUF3099 domain-containing protein [Gordonia sp. (in: high G+C Gram-positive bacteria)]|uniref:DUF3099 domain-containing protein n=1 Tax=Gordonia sp. (in: high G+C Gram-positive bacteria) TaxID=84139 RepID=UPI0039E5A375